MTRKAWLNPEATPGGRPGSVKATTLADIADRGLPRKPEQCRICLAEVPLRKGICRDRAACEERQPPLIPLEEL